MSTVVKAATGLAVVTVGLALAFCWSIGLAMSSHTRHE